MPRTTNKSVRLTPEELERVTALLQQLPEYSSEADLLKQAALLGLHVLATQANRPGVPGRYAGYPPADLAAQLQTRLLPALMFLVSQQALPPGFAFGWSPPAAAIEPVVPEPEAPRFDAAAAANLEQLGSGWLDDDD
ncbi:MAG TPA: hypothetical protein VFS21_02390 [Roseiflexaceae bacterium]|nr:hypothetical protein [Roseiflexaceae bacterium]